MFHARISHKFASLRGLSAMLLTGTFIVGFLAGVTIVSNNPNQYTSLMHGAINIPASFIGSLAHVLMPFILTAILYNANRTELFYILCFWQALTYGIVLTAIIFAYRSAYWLITTILLFTETIAQISLIWFWLNIFSSNPKRARDKFAVSLLTAFSASIIDYSIISPFFTSFTI